MPNMKVPVQREGRASQLEQSQNEHIRKKTELSHYGPSGLFPVLEKKSTEHEGRDRQQQVPLNESNTKTLVEPRKELPSTFQDDESSANRFPPYSPGSSYDQQDVQATQQEIERLKKQEESEKETKAQGRKETQEAGEERKEEAERGEERETEEVFREQE